MKKIKDKPSKLTGIYMDKFQSILDPTFINVEGLTFLYGPNSAGKSSILDALMLLKDISDGFPKGGGFAHIDAFEKQSNVYGTSVGIEFIAGNIEFDSYDKKIQQWRDVLEDRFSEEIFDFHTSIAGKKVQIEIGDLGETFKVAIDGAPLFEFTGSNDDPSKLFSDQGGICGEVKIHKNNKWFNSLYLSPPGAKAQDKSNRKNRILEKEESFPLSVLVKKNNDLLVVRGIEFSLRPLNQGRVTLHHTAHDTLFFKYDENEVNRNAIGKKAADFLFDNYAAESPNFELNQKNRRELYFELQHFSENLDLIIDGFFFQMNIALRYSHVLGDRKIINSNRPIDVIGPRNMRNCIEVDTDYTHLKNYAQYLAHIKNEYSFIYPKPVIKIDFVNRSLKYYLHSMKDYKVVSESYRITYTGKVKRGNEESEIFFLSVRNPKMQVLGFQDVGSGLSYIMPVLTSLWNHEFSIIEQPELHLHPKAQCEMGDVFISAYNKGSVALVESHSEHLLLRILRRIRETTKGEQIPKELKLRTEDVFIYYFDPVAKGHTVVKKIRVDRHGELLDLWPGGFFSERDSELFA